MALCMKPVININVALCNSFICIPFDSGTFDNGALECYQNINRLK